MNFIVSAFQHCCICGGLTFKARHLCSECLTSVNHRLEEELRAPLAMHRDWRGYPLISLGTYRDPVLSRWIKSLKGGDQKQDFLLLAKALLRKRQLMQLGLLKEPVFVVPCPAQQGSGRDHALCLARALSSETQWELQNTLTFQGLETGNQKKKGVFARQERKFISVPPLSLEAGTVIFVDDVVTTGSTASAAWKALGCPNEFEVWCIAHQPKLAVKDQL